MNLLLDDTPVNLNRKYLNNQLVKYLVYVDHLVISYLFVHSDTNGPLCHVKHNTCSSMVIFERHTLVNGRVDFDINIITALYLFKLFIIL